jgi:acyl-CoA synthetase (AMP-forming)/AMP-acid ligase II
MLMNRFASVEDVRAIEGAGSWESRGAPATLYQLLSGTARGHGHRNAISFQILSGPKDKAETLTWSEVHAKVTQAANLFRSLGVGETDTVAYILPNCNEAVIALIGAAVAGIANPINPLLDAEQIGRSCARRTPRSSSR